MTRSVLQPIRSRRVVRAVRRSSRDDANIKNPALTPATRKTLSAIGALWVSFAVTASATASSNRTSALSAAPVQTTMNSTADMPAAVIDRGRYIVEEVGLCGDGHTPRNEKEERDRSRWLGSALPFQPTVPMPWAPAAPPIAGLPSMSQTQGVVFLTTGKRPDGSMARPPMPEFRLKRDDATAVIAYLKSLSK
jgi:hypothetical protein